MADSSPMATEFLLGLDALVRSVGINERPPPWHFLGAGYFNNVRSSLCRELHLGMEAIHLLDQQPGIGGSILGTVAPIRTPKNSTVAGYAWQVSRK